MNSLQLREFILGALKEDIGIKGDITTDNIVPIDHKSTACLIAKEQGILAGVNIAQNVFEALDANITVQQLQIDGSLLQPGSKIAEITGNTRSILTAERVALNIMQRLSGIATLTRRLVDLISDLPCVILDTRKTLPGLRMLDKYAVRVGGGVNHRYTLSDQILIKDNHIKVAGNIKEAIKPFLARNKLDRIQVEVDNLDQLDEALRYDIAAVLLDNMKPETIKQAVDMIPSDIWIEASGGITEINVREIAETGVDAISMGMLTHSVKSLDISLDF